MNSISWAPNEYGLILACGSSDGCVSVLINDGDNVWTARKILNAHTVRQYFVLIMHYLFINFICFASLF